MDFLPPHYVGRSGEMDEREDGGRDGALHCSRDRGFWVEGGGMNKGART